jgi:pyruvate ferredoxin oxidoreductase gamma subunit
MSKTLYEIRWHGRGGQGAWTASLLMAQSALLEGKYVQSFPEFGPERMGAPIRAFTRISNKPIDIHCGVYEPEIVVVLDPTILRTVNVLEGLPESGTLIVNERRKPEEIRREQKIIGRKIWVIPATDISIEVLGRDIPNTAMLGATVKATGVVKLESLMEATKERFRAKIGELNIKVIERAYNEAILNE